MTRQQTDAQAEAFSKQIEELKKQAWELNKKIMALEGTTEGIWGAFHDMKALGHLAETILLLSDARSAVRSVGSEQHRATVKAGV